MVTREECFRMAALVLLDIKEEIAMRATRVPGESTGFQRDGLHEDCTHHDGQ